MFMFGEYRQTNCRRVADVAPSRLGRRTQDCAFYAFPPYYGALVYFIKYQLRPNFTKKGEHIWLQFQSSLAMV